MSEQEKDVFSIFGDVSANFEGIGILCKKAAPHHLSALAAVAATESHARRIVACVNACQSIPTEQLEAIGQLSETGFNLSGIAKLKTERDALQADNARLREVVANIAKGDHWSAPRTFQKIAEKELAATPEQSLARLKNQVREECEAVVCRELFDSTLRRNLIEKIRAIKEPE